MYIAGIYLSEEDHQLGYSIEYSYILLYTLIVIERMSIQWLQNRFLVFRPEVTTHLSQSDRDSLKNLSPKDKELMKIFLKEQKIQV